MRLALAAPELILSRHVQRPAIRWPENSKGVFDAWDPARLQRIETPQEYAHGATRVHRGKRQTSAVRRQGEGMEGRGALQGKSGGRLNGKPNGFCRRNRRG